MAWLLLRSRDNLRQSLKRMYVKISVIEQNVQTIESHKIQAMWVKFVVISQGPDLNDDNNENQHLKVVLCQTIYSRDA